MLPGWPPHAVLHLMISVIGRIVRFSVQFEALGRLFARYFHDGVDFISACNEPVFWKLSVAIEAIHRLRGLLGLVPVFTCDMRQNEEHRIAILPLFT